ncbi:hypothetical protein [Paenibacillus crassostreae]|uniref:Rad50/SbcC-type AAA domain-containing protein n=1 Tax=Paenibacillus crassostreae TaxID=1763538 RepID=A0A167EI18_9BACL|nr:hypothetical protein [Paenibacillus crassostreae]AOZ94881.1 hypothetical protein LPB68_21700 [Paenibacillus crassostreae]OAB75564.1 hypothetical protein PNBC_07990 [Paenibacillus crassostreae]
MNIKLHFNRLFVYSEDKEKFFNCFFGEKLNVIYGKNTSGKSTLFHSILYAMGINENNKLLSEILEYDVFFRLDCSLVRNDKVEKISFIREDETLVIVSDNAPIKKFIGISANTSTEHVRLKEYINSIFGFSLKLEQKGAIKSAPLEALVLPYYVAQSVGWVYLRKSFNNLDFFRNFKEDYLDYYTGITNYVDREEKSELEKRLRSKESEIEFFSDMEKNNEELAVSKLVDEKYLIISIQYLEEYSSRQLSLVELEKDYTLKCNELSYLNKRESILRRVLSNHKKQAPQDGICPTCEQTLPDNIADWYKHYQEENDTINEIKKCRVESKNVKSKINSLRKSIETGKLELSKRYNILNNRNESGITLNSWIDNKANVKLIENCEKKIGQLILEKKKIEEDLRKFGTEEEVLKERNKKGSEFANLFVVYLREMGINNLNERRYNNLFEITAFPLQGVELHKTVMAYHFAFNKYIKATSYIHRIPFMLDAIFKEDIEIDNKDIILKFIEKHKPNDTQTIVSIADTKNEREVIKEYNKNYFYNEATLICIGDSSSERAFLSDYNNFDDDYIEETIKYLNGVDK